MENEEIEDIMNGQESGQQEPDQKPSRKQRKIAELSEKVKALSDELEAEKDRSAKLKEDFSDMRDQYLRLQAEWDNYRRRTAKERLELIDNAGKDILAGFLPVVDDCQRAMEVLRTTGADSAAVEGTELIYNKLLTYLKQRGVERIEALGKPFDPAEHEAVAYQPSPDKAEGTVIYETRKGYRLADKVVRPASVIVSSGAPTA